MTTITLDIAAFRAAFPAYSNATTYPDVRIQAQFDLACAYVSPEVYGCMSQANRTWALWLCTAHLLWLGGMIANGGTNTGTTGIVTSSKVGDVAVSLAAPPYGTSQWRYWLSLTPWGLQLVALLDAQSVGGFFVGGLPERSAFRKVGGVF